MGHPKRGIIRHEKTRFIKPEAKDDIDGIAPTFGRAITGMGRTITGSRPRYGPYIGKADDKIRIAPAHKESKKRKITMGIPPWIIICILALGLGGCFLHNAQGAEVKNNENSCPKNDPLLETGCDDSVLEIISIFAEEQKNPSAVQINHNGDMVLIFSKSGHVSLNDRVEKESVIALYHFFQSLIAIVEANQKIVPVNFP